jgi:tape measure domain-containing protein
MSVVANVAINVDAANAIQQLNRVKTAATDVQGGFNAAATGAKGLGGALQAALGPLLTITTALTAVKAGLDTAFERGAAEQRLRNLTSGTDEFNAAMALAADTSAKFGLTQTESTKALADVYGRLKGVGFGLQETGQIYQGFNAIALQSGLAGAEAAGAFFQLSQALGKGKLNGDEFVIVAERMPQLLDAIAQTTGKSRGELQGMAQDGKITSQVLYEALSGAAGASENLNDKLTAQQQTFNNLRQVTDQLLNSIGQVFAPAVVAGAQGLATVGQMLADWWSYLGNVIFPKVYEAIQPVIASLQAAFKDIDFDAIRVAIQSIMIKGFENAIVVISNFSKVLAFVIDSFKALSQNPVFQFIAEQVGRLAGFLGLTNDKVGEFKQKQDEATQAAAATVKQYSGLPPQIEDAKAKQKELNAEFQRAKDALSDQSALREKQLNNEVKIKEASDDTVGAADARLRKVEEEYGQRQSALQLELEYGKITKEQYQIKSQIVEEDRKGAEIAEKIRYSEELRRQTQDKIAQQKEQEAIATEALAESQAKVAKASEQHAQFAEKARSMQQQAAEINLSIATTDEKRAVIAGQISQLKTAQAKQEYETAIRAEGATDSYIRAAAALKEAKIQSFELAANMARSAAEADRIRNLGGAYGGREFGGAYAVSNVVLQEEGRAIWQSAINQAMQIMDPLRSQAVLTDAEMRIAELQRPYLQAQQRQKYESSLRELEQLGIGTMAPAPAYAQNGINRYGVGATNMAAPQVNITTGPVTQMDGTNYVTMGDLQQATSTAARQGANAVLSQLQSNPSLRRTIGVAR